MRCEGELLSLLDDRVVLVGLGAPRIRNLLPTLVRYLRQRRPAAVLANMWPLTALTVLAAHWARLQGRVVLVEHTSWSRSVADYGFISRLLIRPSMRWLFPKADARIAVSEGAARDLEAFAGLASGSVHSVDNPVTGLPPSPIPAKPAAVIPDWALGTHRRLIAIGSFKSEKRHDLLLQAFSILATRRDAKLLILGDGAGRPALERQVAQLGLGEQVFLPGFVLDPRPYLAAADLFVLSSDFEGFGNVIAEALEQGRPVVSTDCPSGPREILADGRFGALVPVDDVAALSAAMDQALSHSHDREVLKHRAADFSVGKAADAYLDLLLPGWRETSRA